MGLTPFPSAGKQLEKVLSLCHARSYENPSIFDFKRADSKIYQNRKQGYIELVEALNLISEKS